MTEEVNENTFEELRTAKREILAQMLTIMSKKNFAELHTEAQCQINGPLLDGDAEHDTVMPTDEFMPLKMGEASDAVVKEMAKDYQRSLNAFELDFQRRWIPKMTDELILEIFSNENAVPDVVFQVMTNYGKK